MTGRTCENSDAAGGPDSDALNTLPVLEKLDVSRHVHHWLIGVQNGPSSEGVCKECGERRAFINGFKRQPALWIHRSAADMRDTAGGS